ncbi:MAG: signal peptidase I [Acidobacteriota bacterium]|nr:signal peptidase I [Acidobacteriota bacterium]
MALPPQLPAVKRGLIAALVLLAVCLAQVVINPVFAILYALVLLVIAMGLRAGHAWSGYGGALVLTAKVAGFALLQIVSPEGVPGANLIVVTMLALFNGAAAVLLFLAGRALSHRRAGRAAPWVIFAALVFAFSFVFEPLSIPTSSMADTLLIGDCVLVQRIGAGSPARGSLIAFRYPVDPLETYIKRVVAIGGDRLQFKDKRLYINGTLQQEPYAIHKTQVPDLFRDNFPQAPEEGPPMIPAWWSDLLRKSSGGELVVPPGKFFVLGDNRDSSLDSRYWGWVEPRHLRGRPVLLCFSSVGDPARPRLVLPGSIRWNRFFKLVR